MTFVSATKRDLRATAHRVWGITEDLLERAADQRYEHAACDAIALGFLVDDLRALCDRLAHWQAMDGDVSALVARERLKNRGAPNST